MGMTIVEKILARNASLDRVVPGEIVEARVDVVMLHDIGTPGIQRPFHDLGTGKIADHVRCVIVPDHYVPAPTVQAAENLKLTREWAQSMGVKYYYEPGRGGISHQIMIEQGHCLPGQIIVAPDSHATTYGACGALGTGLGVTDTAIALATGQLWFQVPQTVKIELTGEPGPYVSAKDIALFLLSQFGEDELIYKAIEIAGPAADRLTFDGRACIANMALEMGVKTCLFTPDEETLAGLRLCRNDVPDPVKPDPDAAYERVVSYDVSQIPLMVASPHSPSNGKPVSEVAGVRIHQAFLGSCTNGRIEDLRVAASLMRGRSAHPGIRMIVTPASQQTYRQAIEEGLIQTFINAGALVTNPGCGVCIGGHLGLIASDEVCISTSNRNFMGRMGSRQGQIYLASPAVVAASALAGQIADPRSLEEN
jgi:3-isopropylmalate/(R)-2-methylmalate dehydratase large subunit